MTRRVPPGLLVGLGIAAFAAAFTYLAWRRQDAFYMSRFDLGNMSQAVWSTVHGRPLEVTDAAGNQIVRLGVHVDPLLILMTPFYWIWANAKMLLLIQAAVVALGALPVWWIARAELPERCGRVLPLAFVAIYLLYPPLDYATLTEFHPVTLAVTFLLFCIWYLRQRQYPLFAVFAVLAVACKEEIGLLVAALGIYAAIVWRDRRAGALVAGLGVAWFLVAIQVVVPSFNQGAESELLSRYERVGGDVPGIARTLFTDPLRIAEVAFAGPKLGSLIAMLAALALLPLLAPFALLVALPELAVNLLSDQAAQSSYRFHYAAPYVPFFIWSAVLGARRLVIWLETRRPVRVAASGIAVVALAAVVAGGWLMGPLPFWSHLPGGSKYLAYAYRPNAHDAIARRALALIPAGAPVSASNHFGAHLSERRCILTFPQMIGADYVIVDEREPSFGDQNGTSDQAVALVALRQDPDYGLIFSGDGVLVFRLAPSARRIRSASQTTRTRFRKTTGQTKPGPSETVSPACSSERRVSTTATSSTSDSQR